MNRLFLQNISSTLFLHSLQHRVAIFGFFQIRARGRWQHSRWIHFHDRFLEPPGAALLTRMLALHFQIRRQIFWRPGPRLRLPHTTNLSISLSAHRARRVRIDPGDITKAGRAKKPSQLTERLNQVIENHADHLLSSFSSFALSRLSCWYFSCKSAMRS